MMGKTLQSYDLEIGEGKYQLKNIMIRKEENVQLFLNFQKVLCLMFSQYHLFYLKIFVISCFIVLLFTTLAQCSSGDTELIYFLEFILKQNMI